MLGQAEKAVELMSILQELPSVLNGDLGYAPVPLLLSSEACSIPEVLSRIMFQRPSGNVLNSHSLFHLLPSLPCLISTLPYVWFLGPFPN